MLQTEIDELSNSFMFNVLTPLKRPLVYKNYLDLGFDTEYTKNLLLSIQLSILKPDNSFFTRIYYIMKESINPLELFEKIEDFLGRLNVKIPNHIFLISHFSSAELKFFQNYFMFFKLRTYGKALGWEGKYDVERRTKQGVKIEKDGVKLHVVDLAGFFKMGLERIGEFHNYPKYSLENIDDQPELYWKQNMDLLLKKHPTEFEEYAKRDSEITLLAFKKLYEEYIQRKIDIHRYPTLPSAALADLRLNFLKESPYPTDEIWELAHQKKKDGWRRTKRKKIVFGGDMNVRLLSVRCLWGAINSAYIRGARTNVESSDMIDIDVSHLYPTAAVTQPLPVKSTKFIKFENWDLAKNLEGWCKVEFEYPKEFMYPCLPVRNSLIPRLVFPTKGISYCTLDEVKTALKFGCKIHSITGYGFKPSTSEIDHPLKPFFQEKMKRKSSIKRGTPEYAQVKGELVMVVGKFGEKGSNYPVNVLQDHISDFDSIEEFRERASTRAWREKTKRKIDVGKGWLPEWYSLILGRSRSIMAQLIPYNCLTVSTDGGVWLKTGWQKIQNLPIYTFLKNVGSGMRMNTELDCLCEIRSRLGCGWYNGKASFEHRHGVHIRKNYADFDEDLFIHLMKLFLKAKRQTIFNYVSKRLTSVKDDLLKGTGLFNEEYHVQNLNLEWKPQRKIRDSKISENPFTGWSWTDPYETIEETLQDEYKDQPEPVKGRPRRIPEAIKQLMIESDLPSKKLSEHILKEYGVKVSSSLIRKKREGIREWRIIGTK